MSEAERVYREWEVIQDKCNWVCRIVATESAAEGWWTTWRIGSRFWGNCSWGQCKWAHGQIWSIRKTKRGGFKSETQFSRQKWYLKIGYALDRICNFSSWLPTEDQTHCKAACIWNYKLHWSRIWLHISRCAQSHSRSSEHADCRKNQKWRGSESDGPLTSRAPYMVAEIPKNSLVY